MPSISQTGETKINTLCILAYVQHMARTAHCDSARRMFELFSQQEKRLIEVNGGSVSGVRIRIQPGANAASLGKRGRNRAIDALRSKDREEGCIVVGISYREAE